MSEGGRVEAREAEALEALKASFRGVLRAGEPLDALRDRVESLTVKNAPDAGLISELARVGTAVAVAGAALRSLCESFSQRAPNDTTPP